MDPPVHESVPGWRDRDPVRAAMQLVAWVDEGPWHSVAWDEDLDEDDEDEERKRKAFIGVEPDMNLRRQVRKFDRHIERARGSGDHGLADYLQHLRGLMLDDVKAGKPRPYSQWLPMAEEEFDL